MHDCYLLLTPILVLGVLALVRFVGCDIVWSIDEVPPAPLEFAKDPVLKTLRPADFSGFAGMAIDVGSKSLKLKTLERWCVAGSTGDHRLQIIDADTGFQVPGSAVIVSLAGRADGFVSGTLTSAITLDAGKRYYIVSEEVIGGDGFFDNDTLLTTRTDATVFKPVYFDGTAQQWVFLGSGASYGPMNFSYENPN